MKLEYYIDADAFETTIQKIRNTNATKPETVLNLLDDGAVFKIYAKKLNLVTMTLKSDPNTKDSVLLDINTPYADERDKQTLDQYKKQAVKMITFGIEDVISKTHYTYTEKTRTKVRTGRKKEIVRSKVTYITPNRPAGIHYETHSPRRPLGHKFPVRGHWRSIKGLGKNYLGEKV